MVPIDLVKIFVDFGLYRSSPYNVKFLVEEEGSNSGSVDQVIPY